MKWRSQTLLDIKEKLLENNSVKEVQLFNNQFSILKGDQVNINPMKLPAALVEFSGGERQKHKRYALYPNYTFRIHIGQAHYLAHHRPKANEHLDLLDEVTEIMETFSNDFVTNFYLKREQIDRNPTTLVTHILEFEARVYIPKTFQTVKIQGATGQTNIE